MQNLDPTFIGTLSIAGGVAVAMLTLASRSKMVELRDRLDRCPSCRRLHRRGTVCPCAG